MNTRAIAAALCLVLVAAARLAAQTTPAAKPAPPPPVLDKMLGTWVLRGTIEGKQTTHDVDVAWVLNHGYLRLHEVSREKTASGAPEYEAIVMMAWDPKANELLVLWLDTTSNGGLTGQGIGHARVTADAVPIVITMSPTVAFYNTMTYSASSNSWTWAMDGAENGTKTPFARLTLTRK